MYNRNKHNYEVNDRHVLCVELEFDAKAYNQILRISNIEHFLSNHLSAKLNKMYDKLNHTKKYHRLKKAYGKIIEKQSKYEKKSEEYEILEESRKEVSKKLENLIQDYGITFSNTLKIAQQYIIDNKKDIHSVFVRTTTENIWQGMENVLYGNGKHLHFKSKMYDNPTICAKEITRGISLKLNKNNEICIRIGQQKNSKYAAINLKLKKNNPMDYFLLDEITLLKKYLMNQKENDKKYKDIFNQTGIKQCTHRPCYVSIVIKNIRNKMRIYAHITIVCRACKKLDRYGNLRHQFKSGKIAADLGTQSVAIVAKDYVDAKNLAERNFKNTKSTIYIDKKLQQKMNRSRQYTNANNYNENGTIKKGTKKKWYKSKNYKKVAYRLHEKRRKDSLFRKYATQEIVNDMLEHGNMLITEKNDIKSLQKRSKKPTENSTRTKIITKKDGTTKIITKKKRKKRFGLSILHRCPGYFMAECKKKFKKVLIVDKMFRASQYDHTNGEYTKKDLNTRWFQLSDGTLVQRDLYSAFLMYCADLELKNPDQYLCNLNFDMFMQYFKNFDKWIKDNNIKIENYY